MYKHLLSLGVFALAASHPFACANAQSVANVSVAPVAGSVGGDVAPLTLAEAFRLAEWNNAQLRREAVRDAAARGEVADAHSLLWNNPKMSVERVRRSVDSGGIGNESRREWSAGIEQTFEIAGQQGHRRRAADKELAALGAGIAELRANLRYEVEQRFIQVLALQERIATESIALKTIEDTAGSIGKRVAAGEDSRLDGNLARVEAVRARNQTGVLEEQLIAARAELATLLQLPPERLPRANGDLVGPIYTFTLDQLQSRLRERPLFSALNDREEAARSRLALEKASRYPDLTIGVATGREGAFAAREKLTAVTVSVPLPLFRRNGAAVGRAATELSQVRIERDAAARDALGALTAAWQKLQSLNGRVSALSTSVLPALEENQRLSAKALSAGEISLVQLLLVNRQLLEGRRDLIDAQSELRLTQIDLMRLAGLPGTTGER